MTLEEAKEAIELRDNLKVLYKEPTFKKVFIDGFMRDEPTRVAQALTNPEMQDEVNQRMLDEMLRSAGHLNNYLQHIIRVGNNIEIQLKDEEERKEQETKMKLEASLREDRIKSGEIEIDKITGEEIVRKA